jgi:thioredoxin-dependent peroxiredoxin
MPTSTSKQIGEIAPNITAKIQNSNGAVTDFDLYAILESGQKVMIVFYPGDDTPGCTAQLCRIRDLYSDYQKAGITVVGINQANSESHFKFITKHSYQFGIIVDDAKTIRESYGAVGSFFGKATTKRSVFLINSDKVIAYRFFGQQDDAKVIDIAKDL